MKHLIIIYLCSFFCTSTQLHTPIHKPFFNHDLHIWHQYHLRSTLTTFNVAYHWFHTTHFPPIHLQCFYLHYHIILVALVNPSPHFLHYTHCISPYTRSPHHDNTPQQHHGPYHIPHLHHSHHSPHNPKTFAYSHFVIPVSLFHYIHQTITTTPLCIVYHNDIHISITITKQITSH